MSFANSQKLTKHNVQNEGSLPSELDRKNWKSFIQSAWNLQLYFFFFYTAAWSRQRPLSCWSWHGRNDFRLLINRTWKQLAKVIKWPPIVCLLLLTVMKSPEKYECGSLRVKISECGWLYIPARERTGKWKISGISSFVGETPAQNGRVGRYVPGDFWNCCKTF